MHKSQEFYAPARFETTPIELLSLDDEGSQTPKRQNLASTANRPDPSYILEYLSASFNERFANQTNTVHTKTPEQPKIPVESVTSPTEVPTPSSSDHRAPLPAPAIIKQPAPALKTWAINRRPSATALRKMAQFRVQRERQRRDENPEESKQAPLPLFPNERAPKSPSEEQDVVSQKATTHKTTTMGSKKVTFPTSPHPPRNAVNFLADPSVQLKDDKLLAMPGLSDDEDLAQSSRMKLSYKKSNSIVSLGEDDSNMKQPQRASMPNMPNSRKQTMFQEAEQMAEAQKSLESLSPVALEKLIKLLSSDKSKTSTIMKELIDSYPPGCFVVESAPGLYHLLEPKTLAMFVAKNRTSQRTHIVGTVTIHKEEEETPAVKALNEVAGKKSKRERIIYEV